MARTTTPPFRCTECGWTSLKWAGRCGECQKWGTVVDVTSALVSARGTASVRVEGDRVARPITQVEANSVAYWPSGIAEFDRVLGGGIVPGAAILLSGEPGVGKSTLLLEVASRAAATGARVLYVTAEESASQVRLRAQRTGAMHDNLFLAAEVDLSVILGQIDQVDPQLVIVDSVQTVSSSTIDGIAGGTSQVREVASTLIRVSKDRNLPVLLVGHVTKDGTIAGPRLLEHLVDVVCQFEGDRQTALRFIRAHKNRFGPTDEVGCFEMTGDGIAEVADPSGLFMSRNGTPVSGTCITVAMEGRRALPVEVQALIVASSTPQPRRVVNGVDSSRVAMLLAVLERRAGIRLGDADVYVSTVGGIKITEPGADLAIALALASASREKPFPQTMAAVGEISLAGEIRPVSSPKQRASEARRLGFTQLVDAESGNLREALRRAFSAAGSERDRELDRAF
ncbi:MULTISPECIES: DNA repair protein RadA [Frigoribacterium]|jgi:DNA repair protein RadA/Sms|uniref:DNA repair protein RadA n=1 Tax=Frigoribacterium TaxID=96492 RepID=UPI0007005179|nr:MULTISPECIES: DNA repair protein RadA [Frigoribacterium]KQM29559.1 DNA repair protein RadA [Frigoribacterium sp. Leaf8]KQN41230.1 DNA repair protein RadA [Frigoribacterium sp. Leaf44]KQO48133.1 DNA repair protein RadA [Frigoribacterium sp. Leaf254]KQT40227.1 DNA repair protein RadA [Frigoribacterium sp. Leaf415]MBD8486990.1 DNA repair protein RadA [Frigoribacterium sp. CFBP 8759]